VKGVEGRGASGVWADSLGVGLPGGSSSCWVSLWICRPWGTRARLHAATVVTRTVSPGTVGQEALSDMRHFKSPGDKLECVMNCCRAISTLLGAMSKPG
jgi:hypothetical protein